MKRITDKEQLAMIWVYISLIRVEGNISFMTSVASA